ncbi:hypothetical protein CPB83DRAFT_840876 [Crepidotus variabilis]|uniref:Uncharacterized protein n=1 Tax=Crepidotus variabilis TaxID=179855 RepID=A0A9P6JIC4_9AGAR|nr:hypothetical protein CPB83DRAFT_840876 [Crepidotus variabilis]
MSARNLYGVFDGAAPLEILTDIVDLASPPTDTMTAAGKLAWYCWFNEINPCLGRHFLHQSNLIALPAHWMIPRGVPLDRARDAWAWFFLSFVANGRPIAYRDDLGTNNHDFLHDNPTEETNEPLPNLAKLQGRLRDIKIHIIRDFLEIRPSPNPMALIEARLGTIYSVNIANNRLPRWLQKSLPLAKSAMIKTFHSRSEDSDGSIDIPSMSDSWSTNELLTNLNHSQTSPFVVLNHTECTVTISPRTVIKTLQACPHLVNLTLSLSMMSENVSSSIPFELSSLERLSLNINRGVGFRFFGHFSAPKLRGIIWSHKTMPCTDIPYDFRRSPFRLVSFGDSIHPHQTFEASASDSILHLYSWPHRPLFNAQYVTKAFVFVSDYSFFKYGIPWLPVNVSRVVIRVDPQATQETRDAVNAKVQQWMMHGFEVIESSTRKRASTAVQPLSQKKTKTEPVIYQGDFDSYTNSNKVILGDECRQFYEQRLEQKELKHKFQEYKDVVSEIIQKKIVVEWPKKRVPEAEFHRYINYGTNAYAFMLHFQSQCGSYSLSCDDKSKRRLCAKMRELAEDPDFACEVFRIFTSMFSKPIFKDRPWIQEYCTDGRAKADALKHLNAVGKVMRKSAIYIGVERQDQADIRLTDKKHLVETPEDVTLGLESGYLNPSNYMLVDSATRVCEPSPTDEAHPIIFWTKNDSEDEQFKPDKIFGAIVYDPNNVSKALNKGGLFDEEIEKHFRINRTHIDRPRLNEDGKLVKSFGIHQTNGYPINLRVPGETEVSDSIHEARQHEFLCGFLPEFALLRHEVAKDSDLLNDLGYPKLSNFGALGYSASPHLDDDRCSTFGIVCARPESMPRKSSNFFWASHNLLVELSSNAYWFWNASEDEHGTTINHLLMKENALMDKVHLRKHAGDHQATRASVLPKRVVDAFIKRS